MAAAATWRKKKPCRGRNSFLLRTFQRRPCIRGGAALSSPRPTLGRRAPSGPTPAGDNPPNDTRGEMVLAAYGSSLSRANTEEGSLDTLVRRLDQPLFPSASPRPHQARSLWRRAAARARAPSARAATLLSRSLPLPSPRTCWRRQRPPSRTRTRSANAPRSLRR